MSRKKHFALVAFLSTIGSGSLAEDGVKTCLTGAFEEYNRANLALLAKSEMLMTVETVIAQRRLQEQYCLKAARCELANLPPQQTTIALDAIFSRCLRDEAIEKYELAQPDAK